MTKKTDNEKDIPVDPDVSTDEGSAKETKEENSKGSEEVEGGEEITPDPEKDQEEESSKEPEADPEEEEENEDPKELEDLSINDLVEIAKGLKIEGDLQDLSFSELVETIRAVQKAISDLKNSKGATIIKKLVDKAFKVELKVRTLKGKVGLFNKHGRPIYRGKYIDKKDHESIMKDLYSLDINIILSSGLIRKRGTIRRFVRQAIRNHNLEQNKDSK